MHEPKIEKKDENKPLIETKIVNNDLIFSNMNHVQQQQVEMTY